MMKRGYQYVNVLVGIICQIFPPLPFSCVLYVSYVNIGIILYCTVPSAKICFVLSMLIMHNADVESS